jgi:hypothetical protein
MMQGSYYVYESEAGMRYVLFIGADGPPAEEDLAVLRREGPGWAQEMDDRGVRLLSRRLTLPEMAATVRVRDGETLVTDGPFAEAKEFIVGFDVLECTDLDEAIEVAARHPVSWFAMIEIRPFTDALRLGEQASAFWRGEGAASPYMLITWMGAAQKAPSGDQDMMRECEAWRRDMEARGLLILGGPLEGADTATTVRVRDGKTLLSAGPFTTATEFIAGIDVVSCPNGQQASQLAAAHPMARYHAIEVRPFWSE